jgi:Sap-like sulfolipid-1-addressing protein
MGQAIGQVLPLAVAAAITPVPIIASVVLLLTPRAAATGTPYVVGCLLGLIALGAIVLLIAHPADASSNGQPATWVSLLELALGILVLLVTLRRWRSRPHHDADPPTPKMDGNDRVVQRRQGVCRRALLPVLSCSLCRMACSDPCKPDFDMTTRHSIRAGVSRVPEAML